MIVVSNNLVDFEASFFRIMQTENFHLPKIRSDKDYYSDVERLFEDYRDKIKRILSNDELKEVEDISTGMLEAIKAYNNGLPHQAYEKLKTLMGTMKGLRIFQKSGIYTKYDLDQDDPLRLYRVRGVSEYRKYRRMEIFHTPYYLQGKVATCRYSISGYPSLYLGTSLELCLQEGKLQYDSVVIASRFKMIRSTRHNGNINIQVIDLSVKPQDFLTKSPRGRNLEFFRNDNAEFAKQYLYWYPLIATCSFIRKSKSDPFSPEYIIPQLLMQWARERYDSTDSQRELVGVRYFSCASRETAELGFNYVFPVSGERDATLSNNYCSVLANSFELTQPIIIEKEKLSFYQKSMKNDRSLGKVNE